VSVDPERCITCGDVAVTGVVVEVDGETAVDGAVVSNPIAKNTTSRSGCCFASLSASSGE
jgi:hypothetical protein